MTGSPEAIKAMLKEYADKNARTWVQNVPMKDANKAIVDMDAGKAKYRYVLVNDQ